MSMTFLFNHCWKCSNSIKQSVKNLDITLNGTLTMDAHVTNIARTCYFELRRLE